MAFTQGGNEVLPYTWLNDFSVKHETNNRTVNSYSTSGEQNCSNIYKYEDVWFLVMTFCLGLFSQIHIGWWFSTMSWKALVSQPVSDCTHVRKLFKAFLIINGSFHIRQLLLTVDPLLDWLQLSWLLPHCVQSIYKEGFYS